MKNNKSLLILVSLFMIYNQSGSIICDNFNPGYLIKVVQIMAGSFESRTRCMKIIVLSVVCQLHNAIKASFAMIARGGSIENFISAFHSKRTEKLS